jgi:hypothetical protein
MAGEAVLVDVDRPGRRRHHRRKTVGGHDDRIAGVWLCRTNMGNAQRGGQKSGYQRQRGR